MFRSASWAQNPTMMMVYKLVSSCQHYLYSGAAAQDRRESQPSCTVTDCADVPEFRDAQVVWTSFVLRIELSRLAVRRLFSPCVPGFRVDIVVVFETILGL